MARKLLLPVAGTVLTILLGMTSFSVTTASLNAARRVPSDTMMTDLSLEDSAAAYSDAVRPGQDPDGSVTETAAGTEAGTETAADLTGDSVPSETAGTAATASFADVNDNDTDHGSAESSAAQTEPNDVDPTSTASPAATTGTAADSTIDTTASATQPEPGVTDDDEDEDSDDEDEDVNDDDEDEDEDEDSGQATSPAVQLISVDQAKTVAFDQVGGEVSLIEIELDRYGNPPKYDLVLIAGGYKYQLEIHAVTGAIIALEKETADDEGGESDGDDEFDD